MIPLFKPYMPELPQLNDILYSGMLAAGSYTKEFENSLKKYFNSPYILVMNSFANAINVTLTALGIKTNDEVLMSPMACLVSTQPFRTFGCSIRWADIDPCTGTLSPDSVRRRISSRTKLIVHNHFCGYPGYIDEINRIGKENGIIVIDDGIECFGSEYRERKVGQYGESIAIFSLSAVRIPNCIEGGAVIFKDKDTFDRASLIRDSGINRQIFRDELGEINTSCDIKDAGFAATMSNVNAYIGVQQMKKIDLLLQKQRQQAEAWEKCLGNKKGYKLLQTICGRPNYWLYGILADDKQNAIISFREQGYYASGVHADNSNYSIFGGRDCELPGVDEFYSKFVGLPCGWWI